jgi:signal peptidase II
MVLISALIVLDQVTKGLIQDHFALGESKTIIKDFFFFTYVQNKGAAFGMGSGSNDMFRMVVFKILPVFVCFFLLYMVWAERKRYFTLCLGYSLVLGGAVGNLIDRIALDYVVDFLDFAFFGWHFWVFNVADSAVSVGGFFIGLGIIFEQRDLKKKEQELAGKEASS